MNASVKKFAVPAVMAISMVVSTKVSYAANTTYWVAPDGRSDASGSYDNPLDLPTAFTLAHGTDKKNIGIKLKRGRYEFRNYTPQSDSRIDGGTYSYCQCYGPQNIVVSGETDNPEDVILDGTGTDGATRAMAINTPSPFTVSGMTFTNFHATCKGSAIYTLTSLVVTNCWFFDNSATDGGAAQGGALYTDCLFIGNSATGKGGAVNGAKKCAGCKFINNSASNGGGYYSSNGGPVSCEFISNTAASYGALYLIGVVRDCIFTNNVSTGVGGAMGGSSNISGCKFYCNRAGSTGGAINGPQNNSLITNCLFVGNVAGTKGGALSIASNQSNVHIVDCVIKENSAPDGGAVQYGIYTDCTIERNVSANSTVLGVSSLKVPMDNCVLIDNVTTNGPLLTYGNVTQCIAVSNQTVATEKMLVVNSQLTQCTIADNNIPSGGAIGTSSTLVNTIVSQNDPVDIFKNTTADNVLYSTIKSGVAITGANNIQAEDPCFNYNKDQKAPLYALRSSSLARNAGQMLSWTAQDVDLAGRPRINADGNVDIGCYAYLPLRTLGFIVIIK